MSEGEREISEWKVEREKDREAVSDELEEDVTREWQNERIECEDEMKKKREEEVEEEMENARRWMEAGGAVLGEQAG